MLDTGPSERTAPYPVQRQLDELDALLQQMLALPGEADHRPVSAHLENDTPAGRASTSSPNGIPARLGAISPGLASAPVLQTAIEPLRGAAVVSAADPPAAARGDAGPDTVPTHGSSQEAGPAAAREDADLDGATRDLLSWINAGFDRCTYRLGRLGQWLRARHGRNVLGWTGLLLLAASGSWWALGWLHWLP